jgi:hypothetical protein
MAKKQENEKIDIFGMDWQDEFNNDFYFIKGAVDLTRACFSNNGDDVSDESVAAIFEEVRERLDKVESLMDRVWHSMRELKKLTPEQEKKRKMLDDLKQREIIQAIGKIGDKFDKKMIETLERR